MKKLAELLVDRRRIFAAVTLILTRPLVKKFVSTRQVATNADRNLGRTAMVTERIDNLAGTGAVRLDGMEWTARSTDETRTMEVGEQAVVREIRDGSIVLEDD